MAFLGTVIYPGVVVPGKRVKRNFYKTAERFSEGRAELESVVSYLGFMKNLRGKKLTREVFEEFGWRY